MLLEKIDEAIAKAKKGKTKEVITLLEAMRNIIDDDDFEDDEEDDFFDDEDMDFED